ncbi:MAG: cytidine deaminase [Dysgonomonas sp.]
MESFDLISKVKVYTIEECNPKDKELIKSAQQATKTSYSPYSEYSVGAAVLLENGNIVNGSNQENAAYPSGLCAERTALFYANANFPDQAVTTIAIAAYNKGDFTEDVCTPCGSCRQVLVEVETRFKRKVRILMCGKNKIYEVDSIKALLPLCFEKESMD